MQVMNFKVIHNGMPWPVGTVVPPSAFKEYPHRHVELGALIETVEPVSDLFVPAASVSEMDDDELTKENARLQAALDRLPVENMQLKAACDDMAKQVAQLEADKVKLEGELKAAEDMMAESKSAFEQHLRSIKENGPSVPTPMPTKK